MAATLKSGSKGARVKQLQQLLTNTTHNAFGQNFAPGLVADGEFGPQTARAVVHAKYWLGYTSKEQTPVAGDKLFGFLTGKAELRALYAARRKTRMQAKKHPRPTPVRMQALQEMLALAHAHVHEVGANTGPMVEAIQHATNLGGTGWPWCQACVDYAFLKAGHPLPFNSASTVYELGWFRKQGWVVTKPEPGDVLYFDWELHGEESGYDSGVDHVGMVIKVLDSNYIKTVEGNTGPSGSDLSSDPGGADGVFVKTRARSLVHAYVRVPDHF